MGVKLVLKLLAGWFLLLIINSNINGRWQHKNIGFQMFLFCSGFLYRLYRFSLLVLSVIFLWAIEWICFCWHVILDELKVIFGLLLTYIDNAFYFWFWLYRLMTENTCKTPLVGYPQDKNKCWNSAPPLALQTHRRTHSSELLPFHQ